MESEQAVLPIHLTAVSSTAGIRENVSAGRKMQETLRAVIPVNYCILIP